MRLSRTFAKVSKQFSIEFEEVARDIEHGPSSGRERETALRRLLTRYLPGRVGLDTGFVIDRHGNVSGEMDLIAFDAQHCPSFPSGSTPYYPCEGVLAVGQVKSRINSKAKLVDALENVASAKRLDRGAEDPKPVTGPGLSMPEIVRWDPRNSHRDQIWSFIFAGPTMTRETVMSTLQEWNASHPRTQWLNVLCSHESFLVSYETSANGGALITSAMDADGMYCTADEEREHLLLLFFCLLANFLDEAHVARPNYFEYGGIEATMHRDYPLCP